MKKLFVTMLAAMVALFGASPAMAQATRTWVSGVGDDVNPCSRTAPCKTFAGAISKTAAGGEINCLDPAGFGGVTINKSLTIRCVGFEGGVLAAGTFGVRVNAGSTDKIVLDGLQINAAGVAGSTYGVDILQARDVEIVNSYIQGFSVAGGVGINVRGGSQVRVTVDRTTIFGNEIGIAVAPTSTFTNSVKISNTVVSVSSVAAIRLTGSQSNGYISNVVINGTPKSLDLLSGAVMNSYGNNVLNGTATDAPTPTPLQ